LTIRGLLVGFQAIEEQRREHLWQVLPARGNLLVTEQLEDEQANEHPGDGTDGQRQIDLAQVAFFALHLKIVFTNPEGRYEYLLVRSRAGGEASAAAG